MAVEHSELTGNELHVPFNFGSDSGKSGTPDVGEWYFATDTLILYFCVSNNQWLQLPLKVFPARQNDLLVSSSSTTPEGWDDVSSTYNNKFMRISSSTPLSTGGNDYHSHDSGSYKAESHKHRVTGNTNYQTRVDTAGTGARIDDVYHYHSFDVQSEWSGELDVYGATNTVANVPVYIRVKLYKKNSNDVSSYS